jgi:hypothetical protein
MVNDYGLFSCYEVKVFTKEEKIIGKEILKEFNKLYLIDNYENFIKSEKFKKYSYTIPSQITFCFSESYDNENATFPNGRMTKMLTVDCHSKGTTSFNVIFDVDRKYQIDVETVTDLINYGKIFPEWLGFVDESCLELNYGEKNCPDLTIDGMVRFLSDLGFTYDKKNCHFKHLFEDCSFIEKPVLNLTAKPMKV